MADDAGLLDAGVLAGLLAERHRLRVVAALALGAATTDEVRTATGFGAREAATALGRLEAAGLVTRGDDGTLVLLAEAFGLAARASAPPPPDEHGDQPAERAGVLRRFVRDGRLLSIPGAHGKRLVVLDLLAQEFEPGVRYPERTVNQILRRWHPDVAALRRYLVDDGFLDRQAGEYWRTSGTIEP